MLMTPEEEQLRGFLASSMGSTVGGQSQAPTGQSMLAPGAAPSYGLLGPANIPQPPKETATDRDRELASAARWSQMAVNIGNIFSGIAPGPTPMEAHRQVLEQQMAKPIEDWKRQMNTAQLQVQADQLRVPTQDIKEFEYAQRAGYRGTFEEWVSRSSAARLPSSFVQSVELLEDRLGRKLGQDELWKAMYAPRTFQYGDVPGLHWGTSAGPIMGPGAAPGGPGGLPPGTPGGYTTPTPVAPPGAPGIAPVAPPGAPPGAGPGVGPTAGVPGGFGPQQQQISAAEAHKQRQIAEQKDYAAMNQTLRNSIHRMDSMDSQLARWDDLLLDIEEGKVDSSGFPIGRFGKFYDPETAIMEAEGNIAALEMLNEVNLVPVSDADIEFLKSQWMNAFNAPAANRAIIRRGQKIMRAKMAEFERKADYMYNIAPAKYGYETLEGYDRYILDERSKRKKDKEAKTTQTESAGGAAKWQNRGYGSEPAPSVYGFQPGRN